MKKIFVVLLFLTVSNLIFCRMNRVNYIKIMTFNIRYYTANDGPNSWENRKSILIDCLKKYNPDILGTQESLSFQIGFIRDAFPNWKSFGVGRYHNVPEPDRPHESMSGESCTIFYDSTEFELVDKGTFWHSDTPDVPASKTWGNDLPRITTWGILRHRENEKMFVVMNTHFHWDEPYVSNTANLIMRRWREIAGPVPTILMGDFNLEPTSDAHELFCGKIKISDISGNFIDCWQELNKSEVDAGTAHNFCGTKQKARIDWILTTPEFNVRSIDIIYDNENGHYPSDHFPVIAGLYINW